MLEETLHVGKGVGRNVVSARTSAVTDSFLKPEQLGVNKLVLFFFPCSSLVLFAGISSIKHWLFLLLLNGWCYHQVLTGRHFFANRLFHCYHVTDAVFTVVVVIINTVTRKVCTDDFLFCFMV